MLLHGKIYKNKYWELDIYKSLQIISIFYFSTFWTIKGDHCGFNLNIEFLNYAIDIKIYDNRHWNWPEKRFYFEDEEENED